MLRHDLRDRIKAKAIEAGLYAANMPAEVGGAGLDTLTWVLYEKELGRANYALHWTCVARPSNILMACVGEQREKYLFPAVRGEKSDCLAMTEPGVGSDVRGMKTFAKADGDDFVINGTKHFISHADEASFVILFAATGEEDTPRGRKKLITAFLIDMGTPGFTVRAGYKNVSHRGYNNCILEFNDCRVHKSQILGEVHKGFEVANDWLGATRLQVAATCIGRPSGPWTTPSNGRWTATSSASRSASSRAYPSSLPTWRWNSRRRNCSHSKPPGNSTRRR